MNMLIGGLAHSDLAVTVSPTHARELCTAEGGFGLHDMFIGMGDRLNGILNGIDPRLWNPETDPELTDHFSREDMAVERRRHPGAPPAGRRSPCPPTPPSCLSAPLGVQKGPGPLRWRRPAHPAASDRTFLLSTAARP